MHIYSVNFMRFAICTHLWNVHDHQDYQCIHHPYTLPCPPLAFHSCPLVSHNIFFCYYRSLLQNFINKFLVTQLFYQMSPVRNPNPSRHREQGPHSLSLLGACWLSSGLAQDPHLPSTTWERPITVGLLLAMPGLDRSGAMKCQKRPF